MTGTPVLPPETVEGWYALHQLFTVDRAALRALPAAERAAMLVEARSSLTALEQPEGGGWTRVVPLVGARAEVMLVNFRPTFDGLSEVQRKLRSLRLHDVLRSEYSFVSVAELGLYHVTAQIAREREAAGGAAGDDEYRSALAARVEAERASPFGKRRLYPVPPPEMEYVCFYPMSKRRAVGQNWYALPLDERSRLMYAHGLTGRRYAGRVLQIISGAIGLADWEWGVTLFSRDPLEFKRLVTDMRFDEVSAQYAEFGEFFVGKTVGAGEWVEGLEG
ncbi:MAG TPA: hydrogen peroxide-dependent heme synthase [Gemmatimonadales bacterium]